MGKPILSYDRLIVSLGTQHDIESIHSDQRGCGPSSWRDEKVSVRKDTDATSPMQQAHTAPRQAVPTGRGCWAHSQVMSGQGRASWAHTPVSWGPPGAEEVGVSTSKMTPDPSAKGGGTYLWNGVVCFKF